MEVGIIIDDDKPATREMQYSRCVVTKTLINISQDKSENSLEMQHIIYDHGKKININNRYEEKEKNI